MQGLRLKLTNLVAKVQGEIITEGRSVYFMGDKSPKDSAKKKSQKDAVKDKKKAPAPTTEQPAKKK